MEADSGHTAVVAGSTAAIITAAAGEITGMEDGAAVGGAGDPHTPRGLKSGMNSPERGT